MVAATAKHPDPAQRSTPWLDPFAELATWSTAGSRLADSDRSLPTAKPVSARVARLAENLEGLADEARKLDLAKKMFRRAAKKTEDRWDEGKDVGPDILSQLHSFCTSCVCLSLSLAVSLSASTPHTLQVICIIHCLAARKHLTLALAAW